MSKYTAIRRSGGGSTTSPVLNTMLQVLVDSEFDLQVTYSHPISMTSLAASNFTALPSGEIGNTLNQIDPKTLLINFNGSVDLDATLGFLGNSAAFTSPQVIAIT